MNTGALARRPLRVVQWATGNIGTRSLRAVIEHPLLDLVGLHCFSADKVGVDAGVLAGLPPVGVVATDDVDALAGLGADCVLYMPQGCDLDVVCRLLASGANVVTTRGEFHRPASMDPDDRARIEAACAEGSTSIHSTGSSPGFITEAVPLLLTSIQRRLDLLTIYEYADLSRRDSPGLLFDVMGFGKEPRPGNDDRRAAHMKASFGPSLELLADAVGLPLDEVVASADVALAAKPVEIAAGPLPEGTVAAQRVTVSGMRSGEPLLQFRATWYCTADTEPAWDVRPTGWRVTVEGDTPLDVELPFPVPVEELAGASPGYTAHRAVNAVPYVCAAAPGIRTSLDLPQIVAHLG
jgi:4-hydroxy-tetrahydrodipicolinate reductase